ncbi:hypothetical protein [Streptomyces cellulosae]|uniref:Uncharacterized protein n=1 Tax=Streptomyces cellulosae TaxID=1968 RepID=A0ABW7XW67_STRCE
MLTGAVDRSGVALALNHTFLLLPLFRETTTVAAGILRPAPDRPRTVELTS